MGAGPDVANHVLNLAFAANQVTLPAMQYQQTTSGIQVGVDVEYITPDSHTYGEDMHVWAYYIRLFNESEQTVQLKTRHWVITDALGRTQTVDGDGVVGEQPVLKPGQSFEYQSGCPLDTASGAMSGHYMFETEQGEPLKIIIPAFSLDVPGAPRTVN